MTNTDAPTLTLLISAYGGWNWTRERGQMTRVTFTGPNADAIALDYLNRRLGIRTDAVTGEQTSWGLVCEVDEEASSDLDGFPLTMDRLFPSCEHGLSASLCAGPGHYPMD